jgi:rhodanese-related sulfurtransferase
MERLNLAIIVFTFIVAITLLNTGCNQPAPNTVSAGTQAISESVAPAAIKDVDGREAYQIIQNNINNPFFVILDVRTPDEYHSGHIVNAINVDVRDPNFNSAVDQLGRDQTYLVYCQMGGRSATATKAMLQLGFKNLFNLSGGLNQWTDNGYPLVR